MRTKTLLITFLTMILLMLLTVGVFAGDAELESFRRSIETNLPAPDAKPWVEYKVGDIAVWIVGIKSASPISFEYSGGGTKSEKTFNPLIFDVCFDVPDAGEWSLYPMPDEAIQFKGYKGSLPSESVYDYSKEIMADGKKMGIKCIRDTFYIPAEHPITFPLYLSYRDIFAFPKEGGICKDLQHRIATSPKAQNIGLKASCEEIPGDGWTTNQFTATVTAFDRGKVNMQEASMILKEIETRSIYGPWTFRIDKLSKE